MKPKEKATELFSKYFDLKWQCYRNNKTSIKSMTKLSAKHCALLAVDELIKSWNFSGRYEQEIFDAEKEFWQQVKTEIEKL